MRTLNPMALLAVAGMIGSPSPMNLRSEPYAPNFATLPEIRGYGPRNGPRKHEDRSCYTPHQGKRECARRRRQMAKHQTA